MNALYDVTIAYATSMQRNANGMIRVTAPSLSRELFLVSVDYNQS